MSIIFCLSTAVFAYFLHKLYKKIEYSRKRAEYILDRRRAAGIPDEDKRPFAVARTDALKRIARQKELETLSTPTKHRKTSSSRPNSAKSFPDREIAERLAGIPGALPGYLRHSTSETSKPPKGSSPHLQSSGSSSRIGQKVIRDQATPSTHRADIRSPSPIKQSMKAERSSAKKALKRDLAQLESDEEEDEDVIPFSERSPSTQRAIKRLHKSSPPNSRITANDSSKRTQRAKVSVPGQFTSEPDVTDEEMTDLKQPHHGRKDPIEELDSSEMDEDDMVDADNLRIGSTHLRSLNQNARATARKRDVEEVDTSSSPSEDSHDNEVEDERSSSPAARTHLSKRVKAVNLLSDPSSPSDLSIAVPEEAMVDFDPELPRNQMPSTSSSRGKRAIDTSGDRQPGEEWTDYEGLRWRIDPNTHRLRRFSEVLEWRSKYKMPKDSIHPMAKERHQVLVPKWLTKEEWEEAKSKKLLGFQEIERMQEREKLEKEAQEKIRIKQELLAKIRETSSPNKRLNSYLLNKRLIHKRSEHSLVSTDTSMADDTDGSISMVSMDTATTATHNDSNKNGISDLNKPRSRRISLTAANSPRSRASPVAGTSPLRALRYPASTNNNSKSTSGSPLTQSSSWQS